MEITIHRHLPSRRERASGSIVKLRGGLRAITVILIEHARIPSSHEHFSTLQESGCVCRATDTHIPSRPESRGHNGYISNPTPAWVLDTSGDHVEQPRRGWSRVLAAGRNGATCSPLLHAPGDIRV